ncbi:ribosome biogenesis GTP-binding protein YihA/YsxC [soil metagenome]
MPDADAPQEQDPADLIEEARKIFAGPIAFLKSAPSLQYLPDPIVPELAFAGRSNVGKSSLINALTNRNGLARTSNTPGRTQELNFFDVGGAVEAGVPPLFRLVDMPGYGYAKAPKDVVKQGRFLINDYLRGRAVLQRSVVLIDARHGIKDVDREVMEMLDGAAVSYRLVLTKADKIKASELAAVTERTLAEARKRPAAHPEIIATSAEKGLGLPELRAAMIEALV